MTSHRLPFLDWLKCLGMAAIVFWHVAAYGIRLIPPIYPKQLGVTFFLFATGFLLARERRPTGEVLFRRLFDVYLFGVACALLMSAVQYARIGDLNESNYLPFLLGVNVLIDAFPANPTTWYIGTYIHVLLVWALCLRRVQIRPWMLVASGLVEVAVRAWLIETCGLYVAYMALPNWATVFLLGLYYGQKDPEEAFRTGPAPWLTGTVLILAVWTLISSPWVSAYSFPLMTMALSSKPASLLVGSAAASLVYVSLTWMTFQVTRRLGRSAVVEFFARNTLIIFLAHMPLYYLIQGPLERWTDSKALKVLVLSMACFPLLAGISELIVRLVRPNVLRDWLWRRIRRPSLIEEPVAERSASQA